MSAPTAKVRGTFKDSQGNTRNNTEILFKPLGTPFAAGGDVVTSPVISVTTTATGTIGIDADFVLVQGGYRVIISDMDAFEILVPGDGAYHDIEDITADLTGTNANLNNPVTAVDLQLSLSDSESITHTRSGDPGEARTRFVFGGESGALSSGDKVLAVFNASQVTEVLVPGNMNPSGAAGTIDDNIGQWFSTYIYPYSGAYGSGSSDSINHFWYSLGDQDWVPGNVTAVTNYFTYPNNERYFKKVIGNVALFVIDSNASEPDGNAYNSTQGAWLQAQLAASSERWKIVMFRDSPVASKTGYSFTAMEWPFASWGADMVLAAGVKFYERIDFAGIPLIVCGSLAATLDTVGTPIADSQYQYASKRGFVRFDINEYSIQSVFVTEDGDYIDAQQYINSAYGNIQSAIIHSPGGGTVTLPTGVSVRFGSADGTVMGGTTNYLGGIIGKVLRVAYLPTPTEVAENKWLAECLFLVGDDPPYLYYFNKAYGDCVLMCNPDYSSSYHSGTQPKLADPTLIPTSGSTSAVDIDHTDSGVTIYVSENGGPFATFADWATKPYPLNGTGPNWLAVYAKKASNEDSDIVVGQFNTDNA